VLLQMDGNATNQELTVSRTLPQLNFIKTCSNLSHAERTLISANLYWINARGVRLAIVPRPRGQDWLPDDIDLLRRAGIDVIVSALTPPETEELGLLEEAECCRTNGIQFISFPIEDRSVPSSSTSFSELLDSLKASLAEGKAVGVHCRAGIGRSSLIAAALLIQNGVSPETAFLTIQEARGCPVPDTVEQRNWVERYWSADASTPG
jgi:protein-tyrosine phosphatase